MAVVLDGWGVVARRAAVESKLPGGLAGWFEVAPNRMACADQNLCLVAFMVHHDASAFIVRLEAMGLQSERDGAYRDVAIVGVDGPWEHACSWLKIGPHATVNAVWLDGSDPDPLVVPLAWRPNSIINLSNEEVARRFKFLRREGGVEVYLDTETGQEMFRGRTSPAEQLDGDAEQKLQAVAEAIKPLLTFNGVPRKLGWFERRRLARGIRELEALASGERWRAWWFLGMARRAASNPTGAFDAFERAYAANPASSDVSREFGGQCLALGRGDQAVVICERTCMLHPRDAGLRANLALACMIANDMARAKAEVTRALEMDPQDRITQMLATMIDDVFAGNRARPTKYP